ncbi:MAG: 16S rRNA (guanine(527)-N(7))-methyltransferase RsmG [Burkholderiaceae bacterium]|nr:16S rRNA (guanine(527)-N(7))-methyltransferase RsmG [Burkholderiaceae bacterium]
MEAGRRLDEALAQLQLEPDAGQRRQLLAHLALLAKWNAVYNLTALRDPDQMLTQHLFDCLAVLPVLRDPARAGRDHLADGAVVLDVGSGGGLPGVVLAICAPGVQVHCVDAVAKKAAFVRQVRAELGLTNLFAHHARVETLRVRSAGAAGALPPVTLAISRAFASLADFVRLTQGLLAPDGVWAAMKGAMPEDELRALPAGVQLLAAITLGVPQLDARRHLLLLGGRHA